MEVPACSQQLAHLCATNGFEYFHFLQPNQYVPGSKVLAPEEVRDAYRPASRTAKLVPEAYEDLRAAGQQLVAAGVRLHDLTGVYAEVEEAVYIDACCHVNGMGNVYMAREMGAVIASYLE